MKTRTKLLSIAIAFLIGISALSIFPHRAKSATSGLIGYWKFDEGNGDTAYDSAGTNNGIIRGVPAWTTGIAGEALRFDGAQNNYVALSSQLSVNDAMTVEAWVYPEFDPANAAAYPQQFGDAGRQIVRKSSVGDDTFFIGFYSGYYLNHTNPVPYIQTAFFYEGGGGVGIQISIPGLISQGQWYHLAATFKRNDYTRLYVNGVGKMALPTEDKPLRVSSRRLTAGQEADIVGGDPVDTPDTPQTWIGKIDEVKIYNRALTSDEVYNDFAGIEQSPFWMQWWFWTIVALGAIVVVLAYTTVHYRKKPPVSKETSAMQSNTAQRANKVCPNCGASLPADSKFCGKCGNSVE